MTAKMSLSMIFNLLTLIYLAKTECEFYMVGDTKWTFQTPGEVRKLWITTALDNVNISFRFDYNEDKDLYEYEHWFRNPLTNTWYELELRQGQQHGNALIDVHNSQEIQSEHWELPNKRYDNFLVDADDHVLLSVCDPRVSGLHTVIGNCAPSEGIDEEVDTHRVKVDQHVTEVSTSSSSSCDPSGSSSTNTAIFTSGLSPLLGLVVVLGLSILLNIILACVAFRRRPASHEIQNLQNHNAENIYENDELSPRNSAYYIQNVHQRSISNTYEPHITSSRHSTLRSMAMLQNGLKNSYEPHGISPRCSTLCNLDDQNKEQEHTYETCIPSSRSSTLHKNDNAAYFVPNASLANQKYAIDNEGFIPTNDMV